MYLANKKNTEFQKFFENFKVENKDKSASIINGMEVDVDALRKDTVEEMEDKYKFFKQFH